MIFLILSTQRGCHAILFCSDQLTSSPVLAGGQILDPGDNDQLEVGWTIQPYGSVDPIHLEEGDTLQVDFLTKRAVAPFDTVHQKSFTISGDW